MGKYRFAIVLVLVAFGIGAGRVLAGSPDDDVNELMGQQNRIYVDSQPPHLYQYSAPRDVVTQIYDATVPTMLPSWTVFTVQGYGHVDWCESKGVPIPYGAQLTSPAYPKQVDNGHDADETIAMPQPEPNGLYLSGETAATWVLCIRNGQVVPEYHEEIVSTYWTPTWVEDGRIVHGDGPASVTVTVQG